MTMVATKNPDKVGSLLNAISAETDPTEVHKVGDSLFYLKFAYPSMLKTLQHPVAGFPRTRRRWSIDVPDGAYTAIYFAKYRRIVALCRFHGGMYISPQSRWKYWRDLDWIIAPRFPGISLHSVGVTRRPMVGDTLYSISAQTMLTIYQALSAQSPIGPQQIQSLIRRYP